MSPLPEPSDMPDSGARFRGSFQVPQVWRQPALFIVLSIVVVLYLYRETAMGMVEIWSRSETFTHAFLVPPIALWLAWRRRHLLAAVTPQPMPSMLVAIAAAGLVWLLGEAAHANAVRQFALVAMLVLCVPLILGWTATRTILFPLGYLFFCVPVGEFLLPTLMEWTADFTVAALRFTGVPVYREGMNFAIPSGNWSVVEACSGVRYLIASLMVGTLFAYLNYQSLKRRLLFVGVSILVPIIANWVRAYMIVMLGHLSNNQLAVGVDHLIYGWIFFGVVIMIMFVIGARWSEPEGGSAEALPRVAVMAGTARPIGLALWSMSAIALLALPPMLVAAAVRAQSTQAPQLVLPTQLPAGWQAEVLDAKAVWAPRFENPSATAHAVYTQSGRSVGVHVYYYRGQSDDRKLITSTNRLTRRDLDVGWVPLSPASRDSPMGSERIDWRRVQLLMPSQALVRTGSVTVWQAYWAGDRLTANEQEAAIRSSVQRLLGKGDDAAAVFLYTLGAPEEGADDVIARFAADNMTEIVNVLRGVRDAR